MSDYRILLKKELKELFSFLKFKGKKIDIIGLIISLVLTLGTLCAVSLIFTELVKVYTNVNYGGIIDQQTRTSEVLTLVYTGIIVVNTIAGIRKINSNILESNDFSILVRLPIRNQAIFLSKFMSLLISQIMLSTLTILVFNLSIYLSVPVDNMFLVRMILVIILLPCISMLLSSLLALGVHKILKFIRSKYIIIIAIFIALLAGGFLVYSELLKVIRALLQTDTIKFFFNAGTVENIGKITKFLYPANLLSNVSMGTNTLVSVLILLAVCIASIALVLVIVMKMLTKVMKQGNEGIKESNFKRKSKINDNKIIPSLIKKEFIYVVRTPSYAFQYFCTSAVLPLMIYCCVSLFKEFIAKLIGESFPISFELVVFIVTMFGTLTNTFCATNISREGSMFNIEKTLPISPKQFIYSKIVFCIITSTISIFVSCLIVLLTGYVTVVEALLVFIYAILISTGEILFATRKDLNYPSFSKTDDNEVKESNKTISLMIVLSIFVSLLMGGLSLGLQLLKGFERIAPNIDQVAFSWIIKGLLLVISLGVYLIMHFYLHHKLDRKYYETVE